MYPREAKFELRMGGRDHQEKIDEISNSIENMGLDPVREYFISIADKSIKSRTVDVAAFDMNGKLVELHIVSRLSKNGMMLKYEQQTIEDIEAETGVKVKFHSFSFLDNLTNQ